MKSLAIFCILLCISTTFQIQDTTSAKSKVKDALAQIENSPSGDMILSMADVWMSLSGPVDDLVAQIKLLYADLETKLKKENDAFVVSTNNHNNRVRQLETQINSAKQDIAQSTTKLQGTLYPRRKSLENEIATLKKNIQTNVDTQATEVARRKKDHGDFVQRKKDHDQLLGALNEAIKLVSSLKNAKAALIEVRRAQNSLQKVKEALYNQKSTYAPFIQALLELSQNFSDQQAVTNVLNLLNRIRTNAIDSDNQNEAAEKAAKQKFKERMTQLKNELVQLRNTLAQREQDLKVTIQQIVAEEKYLATRQADLVSYTKQLEAEHLNFKNLTAVHNDLVATFNLELSTVTQAVQLLENIKARDYLKQRANQN